MFVFHDFALNFLNVSSTPTSLQADIGLRLSATGLVLAYVSGFADLIRIGTHYGPEFDRPYIGPLQLGGLLIGLLVLVAGKRGIPFMGPYCATKFAQIGMAESLRAELKGTGLHVSLVYPISTNTEFFEVMTQNSGFATRADGPKQSADSVADAIARAIRKPVPEIYPYLPAKGLAVLNSIFPGLTDTITKRWGRKPIRT